MAIRHTTRRLSAGAALVTGLGMVGIAAAGPAQADISNDFEYTCELTNEGLAKEFTDPWKVNLSVDAPEQVDPGAEIPAPEITAKVTPGEDAAAQLRQLKVKTLKGDSTASYTFDGQEREANLTIPQVDVPATGDITTVANGSGQAETAPEEEGTADITAGDFTATLTTDTNFELKIACTAPEDNTVGSVTIGEGDGETPTTPPTDEEPAENDWFTEPQSLALVDNVFTVEGTAAKAGTLSIEVLSGTGEGDDAAPDKVLKTYSWDVEEGDVKKDFDLVEGADYVRINSEDCVDANGNTGEDVDVEGNACSVLYVAPWAADGENGSGDGDQDGGDTGTDNGADDDSGEDTGSGDDSGEDTGSGDADQGGAPEVPTVVQTDGFQRQAAPQQDNTLAIALGGLLLMGAGTGTVLVARRRAAASH